MWRAWPPATRRAFGRRARQSPRARPARRWSACAVPALILPDDAYHHPLQHNVPLVHADRRHRGVGRLQPDPAAGLAIVLLDGDVVSFDEGDYGFAILGLRPLVDDDVVAVFDVFVDHRAPAHLEHVAAAAPGQQLIGDGDRIGGADGFDR